MPRQTTKKRATRERRAVVSVRKHVRRLMLPSQEQPKAWARVWSKRAADAARRVQARRVDAPDMTEAEAAGVVTTVADDEPTPLLFCSARCRRLNPADTVGGRDPSRAANKTITTTSHETATRAAWAR